MSAKFLLLFTLSHAHHCFCMLNRRCFLHLYSFWTVLFYYLGLCVMPFKKLLVTCGGLNAYRFTVFHLQMYYFLACELITFVEPLLILSTEYLQARKSGKWT